MNEPKLRQTAEVCVACGVGLVFIAASVSKIATPDLFATDIKHFKIKILPLEWVNALALTLPWLELLAGGSMFLARWRRAGAWILLGLSAVFAVAVLSAIFRGLDISCGCFSNRSGRVGLVTLGLDLALIAGTGFVLVRGPRSKLQPEPEREGRSQIGTE